MAARECYIAMLEIEDHQQTMCIGEQRTIAEPVEELEEVILDESRPGRTTRMGTLASPTVRQDLANFLRMNQDVFAWSHEDMPGIDPLVIVHMLNVNLDSSPVRQKKRVFAQERDKAVAEEVRKLLEAGFIREVYYPDWLANVVMVRKNNGKWRMCIDFTDLNRACSKDSYPLPRIDTLVDSTARHELLSFMDAFSGYNQTRTLGLHGVPKRYRSQPREGAGHNGIRTPEDSEGSAEPERKSCGPKQIRLQSDR